MFKKTPLASGIVLGIFTSAGISSFANAQDDVIVEEIVITGSRITQPGVISSSPISSIGAAEIEVQQEFELEKIIRDLPSTIPGDGQNVNNGTDGAATVDLRGLGSERNLVLMNGKRITPYNYNGRVDTSTIPTALIERVDIITGGASAVYGSDAIAGAINVILKDDFEGVDLRSSTSQTGDRDGKIKNLSLTLGSNLADGRGNVALNLSWTDREGVLLGDRPLGRLGIETETGANLAEFRAGQGPIEPMAGCGGPDVAAAGGSTTAIPTRVSVIGPGEVGQFLDDGTIFTGGTAFLDPRGGCSVFNFNPYNYYRTPQERYSTTVIGNFHVTDDVEVYSRASFNKISVDQQVAPSGTFGANFDVPLQNPLLGDAARQEIISFANAGLTAGTLTLLADGGGWDDVNSNGVVDEEDYLRMQLRRRTVELGPRSENYDTEHFQLLVGTTVDLPSDWKADMFFQYGESNRTTRRAGYTNLTNIQNALDTFDGVTCNNGDSTCVPIDLFGGFGTITPEAASYATAIALQQQSYDQKVGGLVFNGPIDAITLPSAGAPLLVSVGYEKRQENGSLEPDECLKLAPASCQGGAGGNLLPISGGFKLDEYFVEGILPLWDTQSLNLELGYRVSDHNISGNDDTWKAGITWRPMDSLLVRVMQQQATRAANVAELFSPVTTALRNAQQDPCSVANAGNIDATLRDRCIATGMLPGQVGVVQDIVSGQINTLEGSDPTSPPNPETADTFTVGFVWTPEFAILPGFTLSVDYYDIDIEDVIGEFSAQEILDQCYVNGNLDACSLVNRVNGDFTSPASGISRFTTNLLFQQAEGVEIGFSFGYDLEELGSLQFSGSINRYLTQESQSSASVPVIDCKGRFGTSCDPLSETSWIQRSTWDYEDLSVSLQWRHLSSISIEPNEAAGTFPEFRNIDSANYFDLYASYRLWDEKINLSFGIDNITEEDPPIVGGEAGDTSSNSGNTFPSNYDVLGRMYTVGLNFQF